MASFKVKPETFWLDDSVSLMAPIMTCKRT